MDKRRSTQSSSSRAPLGENPKRANSVPTGPRPQHLSAHEIECKENIPVANEDVQESKDPKASTQHISQPPPINPRISSVLSQASQGRNASKRASQVSTASASSADSKLKTHIGPWQLGKTLGKGSSARVRLARHKVTHQSVAVKIIPKRTAYLSQAGSIAQLDRLDKQRPTEEDGVRRLPVTVEREIAIMKLIEHPNIIQILDVWENRNEIYLILEYCESRDMFSWINKYGPLSEHDAVYVFRQMMCAMEYCHSFNICHRDLKPENILLSDEGQVKIIDFGMAALHQNDQNLRTACGSPHYAAPELLKSRTYRGDKADVWSMGVIFYAMLAQRLPFDDPHLPTMLSLSKRGIYTMPDDFSRDAKDMIRRILVTDPDKRISIAEMWEHPLIQKYDEVEGYENHRQQPIDMKARSNDALISAREIDPQILRQLHAMWHSSDVKGIKAKLTSTGPNEQKMFYHLLLTRRERLLENYDPDLTHSASDYHHLLRPQAWATRVSTREFHTHGRTPSRFTVISTVADTEAGGTVRSYDPYYASRNLAPGQPSRAKITIHRGKLEPGTARSLASGSVPSRMGTGASSRASRRLDASLRSRTVSYAQSQRSSMSSIRSSRQGTSSVLAKQRNKRGVDFSSLRRNAAQGSQRRSIGHKITASASIAGDQTTFDRDTTSPQKPHKKVKRENVKPTGSVNEIRSSVTPVLDEEMVRFSHSIAKDCDDAFGSSLIGSPPEVEGRNIRSSLTPFSIEFGASIQKTPEPAYKPTNPWDSRPLPPTPPTDLTPSPLRLKSVKVEMPSPHEANEASRCGPIVICNAAPLNMPSVGQRRITSAPVYAQYSRDSRPLPSIFENSPDNANGHGRIASAPQSSIHATLPTPNHNENFDFLVRAENTIRIVESPTARKSTGSNMVPAPLNVRKKSFYDSRDPVEALQASLDQTPKGYSFYDPHQQLPKEHGQCANSNSQGSSFGPKKKLSSWLRRASKTSSKGDMTEIVGSSADGDEKSQEPPVKEPPQRFNSTSTAAAPPPAAVQPSKKKSIMFWKSGPKSDNRMSIAMAVPDFEGHSSSPDPERMLGRNGTMTQAGSENSAGSRKIEPQQNWLARLFRVKPAMRFMCLNISARRARQDVSILLREWRKWGMRDIEVDKERNVVFARVGKNNCLKIKEVHFAVEIITVIEHGKRNHLSIVRFTQEKGAASSFHKVVDQMNGVFSSRNIVVQDGRKAKMMIKTLNS